MVAFCKLENCLYSTLYYTSIWRPRSRLYFHHCILINNEPMLARYPYAVDDLALNRTSRLDLFNPSDSSPSITMLKSKRLKNQSPVVEVSPSELVHLPSCGICLTTAVLSKALTPSYQGTRSYDESLHFQPTWSRSSDISIQMIRLPNVTINRWAPEVRMSSHAPSLVQDDSLSRRAIASLSLDNVSTPSTVLSTSLQQPAKPTPRELRYRARQLRISNSTRSTVAELNHLDSASTVVVPNSSSFSSKITCPNHERTELHFPDSSNCTPAESDSDLKTTSPTTVVELHGSETGICHPAVLNSSDSKTKCTTVVESRGTEACATDQRISLLMPLDNARSVTFDASSFDSHAPVIRIFESNIAFPSAAVGSFQTGNNYGVNFGCPIQRPTHPSLETPTPTPPSELRPLQPSVYSFGPSRSGRPPQ